MARNEGLRDNTKELYNNIRQEFFEKEKEGLKSCFIIKALAKKYFKAYSTIEDIIYRKDKRR